MKNQVIKQNIKVDKYVLKVTQISFSKFKQSLKKHEGTFSEIAGSYGLSYDLRDRAFAPTEGYVTTFNQKLPIAADEMYISNTFSTGKLFLFFI